MNTEQNEDLSTEEVIRPGDMLRQAREQLGYSQKDIANRLRLRLSVINDIEDNNFEQSQLATFTRGYVRSYAKFVGLDEAEVLAKLDQHGHAQHQDHEMQSFSRRTKREAHDNRIMRLTWALAIIFVGLTGIWWWQSLQMEQETEALNLAEQQGQPLDESLASANSSAISNAELSSADISVAAEGAVIETIEPVDTVVVNESVEPITSFDDSFSNESEAIDVEEADSADSLASLQTPETTAEDAEVAVVESDLILTFSADCWVDIRDANGKRLDTGIKKSGDVLNLDGPAPFKLVLGAPGAVKISYKGEPVDLSKYPVGKVARLKLPQ